MAKKKKKKRVFKIKNICILLGILLILIGTIYYALTMPIKNIYIKGNEFISDDEIIELASLYEYPSFLLTKKSKLEANIKKNNYIESVTISKKLGNIIEIKIKEYKPIATNLNNEIILENGQKLENIYNLTDVPILINEISNEEIYNNFANKFGKITTNILRQISQIEYSPVEVDEDRFLLYMNDGNLVYITLTKIEKLNKYNKIKDKLEGKIGIIYLDSGNYVELKKEIKTVTNNDNN